MPKRSNDFQKLVFLVKQHATDTTQVTESKMLKDLITGTEREVDVCIESSVGGHDVVVSVECVDRTRRADVTWVEMMKSKHERLPTNALVLVSKKGFSSEAAKVAQTYGIETLSLEEVDEEPAERLFGNIEALWNKIFNLATKKVTVRVAETSDLPPENVVALPDNYVCSADGTPISTIQDITDMLLKSEQVVKELAKQGDATHKGFTLEWSRPRDNRGSPLCLQKENPKVLREIEWIRADGYCEFKVSEFPLQHGMLGDSRVCWGCGELDGKQALLVASEDKYGEKKLSIRVTE